jgi:hypothetical protein
MTTDPNINREVARPEQRDEGFAEGQDHKPDTPAELQEGDFAEGMHDLPGDDEEPRRFSEGQEELPETPDKLVERRFSEGQEISPTSE